MSLLFGSEPEICKSPAKPWLIVGLGNPGAKYAATPHNLGFMVVEVLADHHYIPLAKKNFEARWGKGRLDGAAVVLASCSSTKLVVTTATPSRTFCVPSTTTRSPG